MAILGTTPTFKIQDKNKNQNTLRIRVRDAKITHVNKLLYLYREKNLRASVCPNYIWSHKKKLPSQTVKGLRGDFHYCGAPKGSFLLKHPV